MNRLQKIAIIGVFFLTGFVLFTSCSGDGAQRGAKTATSALIQENKNIVAFGHASLMDIINKTDYQTIPKAKALLSPILSSWGKGFDLTKPMYFAVEAPFDEDQIPATIIGLMDISNKESLIELLQGEMGFALEESGDITYFQDNDVTFGLRNNLFILVSKKGKYDGKAAIEKAFEETEGDESEGKTATILEKKGDIVTGVSLERLMGTSNTSLKKLSQKKQDELTALVADGFVETTAAFNNGALKITSKNMFSEQLKDKLFFKDNNGKTLVNKLGNGKAWMGFAANLDMRKAESFIANYAPNFNKELGENLPGELNFAMMAMGKKAYSSFLSGQLGAVMTGNPSNALGMLFEFNAFIGLGTQGDGIRSLMEDFLSGTPKEGDAYIRENIAIRLKQEGIYANTVGSNESTLVLPKFASKFGTNTFSMFIDFSQIDMQSLELEDKLKVLELAESFVVDANKDGSECSITLKDKNKNVLKAVADFYANLYMDKINGLQI